MLNTGDKLANSNSQRLDTGDTESVRLDIRGSQDSWREMAYKWHKTQGIQCKHTHTHTRACGNTRHFQCVNLNRNTSLVRKGMGLSMESNDSQLETSNLGRVNTRRCQKSITYSIRCNYWKLRDNFPIRYIETDAYIDYETIRNFLMQYYRFEKELQEASK